MVTVFLITMPPAFAVDVGLGVADITPDVNRYRVPLAGYGARLGRPATGVHDPLYAKVMYFRDGETKMALITCDLRSCTPEFKGQIVQKCTEHGLTSDRVFVAPSHTHDGPSMYPEKFWQMQFGVYDPEIVDLMSSAVAKAVTEAVHNAAPARIGFAKGRAEGFTRNRRWEYDTERRKAANETPAVDPTVWVMRVDALDGTYRAFLVNFAAHPTILNDKNMLISAEWPGVLQQQLEKAFPGAAALFTNGAEADQAPTGAVGADDFAKVDDYGTRLARIVEGIIRTIKTEPLRSVGFCRITPALPPLTFPESAKQRYATFLDAATKALPRNAEIQMFRVGPVALVGLPGEPILEVGQAVRQRVMTAGFDDAVVLGLANDYIGYLVNDKEYAHGGYEVESRSYYGPGLGAFLAEQAGKAAKMIE
jgi:hypothetical protein